MVCIDGILDEDHIQCPNGCEDGACVKFEKNCVSWFDGCNTCEVVNGEITICTELPCPPTYDEYEEPKCLEYSNSCDFGCFVDEQCYGLGHRKSGEYCSPERNFIDQLEAGDICDNNFECRSNICVNDQCVSGNLIQRIIEFFSRLFS